jgi:hypothetical protein
VVAIARRAVARSGTPIAPPVSPASRVASCGYSTDLWPIAQSRSCLLDHACLIMPA